MISRRTLAIHSQVLLVTIVVSLIKQGCLGERALNLGDNIPELLDKHPEKNWLVKFYAPWCHHCQQMELTYHNVAEKIYHKHDHLVVGRVDCTKYGKLCEEFQIDSYPTIMFVNKDTRIKYTGDRSENSIIKFAERLSGPSINVINEDCDELSRAVELHHLIILSTLEQAKSNLKDLFQTLANNNRATYWFYELKSDKNIAKNCQRYGIEKGNIYLVKKHLNKAIKFDQLHNHIDSGETNLDQLKESLMDWLKSESLPVYGRLSSRNLERYLQSADYVILAALDEYRPARQIASSSKKYSRRFEKVAEKYARRQEVNAEMNSRLTFAWTSDMDMIEYITLSPVKILPNVIVLAKNFSYNLLAREQPGSETSSADDANQELARELDESNLDRVLDKLLKGQLNFSGGNTHFHTILRYTLGNYNKFMSMYRANPLLVGLVFGFPSIIIIFVIYTIYCYEDDDPTANLSERARYDEYDGSVDEDSEADPEQQQLLNNNGHLKQE